MASTVPSRWNRDRPFCIHRPWSKPGSTDCLVGRMVVGVFEGSVVPGGGGDGHRGVLGSPLLEVAVPGGSVRAC